MEFSTLSLYVYQIPRCVLRAAVFIHSSKELFSTQRHSEYRDCLTQKKRACCFTRFFYLTKTAINNQTKKGIKRLRSQPR